MAATTDNRNLGMRKTAFRSRLRTATPRDQMTGLTVGISPRMPVGVDSRIHLRPQAVAALQEQRHRRRAHVPPMYTLAVVRVLANKDAPLEGHILDLSETGMAVQVDTLISVGQPVTVEFRVSGLGRVVADEWVEFVAAAVVVRHGDVDDFPAGPFTIGLRFVRIATMAQAQIARFVAVHSS
jgi:hypothetical protein